MCSSRWPLKGEVPCDRNQCSIAARSYVWPSAAMTGSSISTKVIGQHSSSSSSLTDSGFCGGGGGGGSGGGGGGGGGVGGADGGAVAQAVRVGVALQTGDFRTFFRELSQMHNLGAEILKPLLPAQRTAALEKICRAYQPSLPVARVATLLGFPGGAAEAGPWLRGLGGVIVRGGETGNEPQLECRATAQALRDLRSGVEAGPPLPPSAARR